MAEFGTQNSLNNMCGEYKFSVINGENSSNDGQPSTRRRKISWAYIAGFLDADGCINIAKKKGSRKLNNGGIKHYEGFRYYRVTVSAVQDKKYAYLLEKIKDKVGGKCCIIKSWVRGRECYNIKKWDVQGEEAYNLLKKLKTRLILKREQAIIAMKLQENIWKWKNKLNYSQRKKLPDKVIAYREQLKQRLNELNKLSSSVAETESENLEKGCDSPNYGIKFIEQKP